MWKLYSATTNQVAINAPFRVGARCKIVFLYSRWRNAAAFHIHAVLEATRAFIARTEPLIDHPFDITSSKLFWR